MVTLFNASLQLAQMLGVVRVSTATGGDAYSVLDTKRTEVDDTWNGGTVWLITDAGSLCCPRRGICTCFGLRKHWWRHNNLHSDRRSGLR